MIRNGKLDMLRMRRIRSSLWNVADMLLVLRIHMQACMRVAVRIGWWESTSGHGRLLAIVGLPGRVRASVGHGIWRRREG